MSEWKWIICVYVYENELVVYECVKINYLCICVWKWITCVWVYEIEFCVCVYKNELCVYEWMKMNYMSIGVYELNELWVYEN